MPFHPLVDATFATIPGYVDSQICQDAREDLKCRHSDNAPMRKRRRLIELTSRTTATLERIGATVETRFEMARLPYVSNTRYSGIMMTRATRRASKRIGQGAAVEDRPLITAEQARQLMSLFKVFGNDSRLRLLHALVREGELCVSDLAATVGLKPQAVSNQLQRLVDRGMLASRREGTRIFYRVVDPCVPVLLERALCLMECCPE